MNLLALAVLLAAPAAAASGPLTLWHAYRGGEEEALERSVKLFTKETGVRVEFLALPYDAFASKLIAAIPHGAGPDVFIFNHERVRQFARMGIVAPVDERLKTADYFSNTLSALEVDGKTYGYPLSLKCLAVYANTRLAPRAPKDTLELRESLARLSSAAENRFGLAYESGDFYFHAPFLFGFGGALFDETGRAVFDTPAMARSLAFVRGLQDDRLIPSEASGALVKSLFNEGRAAMVISGPWFAGEISPAIRYAVRPFPVVSETGQPMRPFLGVEAALVSGRSERADAAHRLARFLSVGEAAVLRAELGGQVPATPGAYGDPRVKKNALVSAFRAAAAAATPMPNTLEMARVWEPMKLALRGVLQGGVSPEKAGALADRRYRALYRPKPDRASPWPYVLLAALALA
ncbi:MAG: extracellular solute-binding protein, partial [Elusimicrobia bacterium]|nr:extracellular solute-binding protein [Elusimicrobiota bacterium]